jgi:hypothetical protein
LTRVLAHWPLDWREASKAGSLTRGVSSAPSPAKTRHRYRSLSRQKPSPNSDLLDPLLYLPTVHNLAERIRRTAQSILDPYSLILVVHCVLAFYKFSILPGHESPFPTLSAS